MPTWPPYIPDLTGIEHINPPASLIHVRVTLLLLAITVTIITCLEIDIGMKTKL